MGLSRILLTVVLLAVISGCAISPQPVYRAVPVAGSDIWYDGKELVVTNDDGLEMVLTFDHGSNGNLVFQLEFLNNSDETVTIDPAKFYYCEKNEIIGSANSAPDSLCVFAIDPEAALLQTDLARSRQKASRQSQTSTDDFFEMIGFVAEVATTDEPTTEARKQTRVQQDQEMELIKAREAREHNTRMAAIDKSHYRWSKTTLRKTTLGFGHSIGGQVSFKVGDSRGELKLFFPVGQEQMEADFRLEKYTPRW